MKVRLQVISLYPGDIKRMRIAAGFDSVPSAARFFNVPEKTWYQWETGYNRMMYPAFMYWGLVGAALAIREDIEFKVGEIPRTEDFPSVRTAAAKLAEEKIRERMQPAREETAAA